MGWGPVEVAATFPATVHEAETCWYNTRGWSAWVDGLERVVEVTPSWPAAGGTVVWQSVPAGRGRVTERASAHEALRGQTVEVSDDSITGRQTVTFTPDGQQVEVKLALEYELRKRSVFTPLVDGLFIRPAMRRSLRSTLARFGAELTARQ